MKKPDAVEAALERLSALRTGAADAATIAELRSALRSRVNLVVAKAAAITGELRCVELAPDLAAAFARLMKDPHRLDKGCAAITEIAGALHEMDFLDPALYLKGIQHVQLEPSFGKPVDAAAKLRALCALGLVRTRHPEALPRVVGLLVDPEPQARIGAVRALGCADPEAASLLLRLKVLTGDVEPDVLRECFAQLLSLSFENSLMFVAGYVDTDPEEVRDAAVLALGEARRPEALAVLRDKWERTAFGPLKQLLLMAFAAARLDEAYDFLLEVLRQANVATAVEVLSALAASRPNERILRKTERIVRERGEPVLERTYREQVGG